MGIKLLTNAFCSLKVLGRKNILVFNLESKCYYLLGTIDEFCLHFENIIH